MPEDATLDEFASGDDDASGRDDERGDVGGRDSDDAGGRDSGGDADVRGDRGRDDPGSGGGDVAPVASTHRFAPDGSVCADCGDRVTRLWRDDDALVCRDCKEWQQ